MTEAIRAQSTLRSSEPTSTTARWCIVGAVIFPLLLFAIDGLWVYPLVGMLDPWLYAGYHMHLPYMWHYYSGDYYGSRVPWTVFGWLVHKVANPQISLIALGMSLFYASTLAIFYTIYKALNNPVAAFIAVAFLGTNSWFLGAIGQNYVDGPTIALVLLSIAAMTATVFETRRVTPAILWGALCAAFVATYLLNAVLVPVEFVMFAGFWRLQPAARIRSTALFWIAGFIGGVAAMSLANWLAGGQFDFMSATFRELHRLTPSGSGEAYYVPWHRWRAGADWLLFPGFATVAGIAFATIRGPAIFRGVFSQRSYDNGIASDGNILVLSGACVVATLGFTFMQLLHWSVLQQYMRATSLWPFAFLAFGSFMAIPILADSRSRRYALGTAAGLLCLLPWFLGHFNILHFPLPYESRLSSPLLITGVRSEFLWTVLGGALLVGTRLANKGALLLVTVAFISFMNVATMSPLVMSLPQSTIPRDQSLGAFDASSIIDEEIHLQHTTIWWSESDPNTYLFGSLGSMFLQPDPILPGAGGPAVLLWSNAAQEATLHQLVTAHGFVIVHAKRHHVHQGSVDFDVVIAEFQPKAKH